MVKLFERKVSNYVLDDIRDVRVLKQWQLILYISKLSPTNFAQLTLNTIALTQINEQIRIIEATVLYHRSYSKVKCPDILAETGSKMVTSQNVFINREPEIEPIKTDRAYCISVSRGKWMDSDTGHRPGVVTSVAIITHARQDRFSAHQMHQHPLLSWILLDIDADNRLCGTYLRRSYTDHVSFIIFVCIPNIFLIISI